MRHLLLSFRGYCSSLGRCQLSYRFDNVMVCRRVSLVFYFIVSSLRSLISSLRMNRVDLGTILTTLNMAAMERCTTSDELQVFIRSNIQQILIGLIGNLLDEKDSIDYLCAAIDKLLDIINRVSSIFCIPSEFESSLRRARHILVDKEDDTMFRKLRRVVEDDLLLLSLKNSWNWVLNMVFPHRKWPNCLEFQAKPFSGGWHEFGLQKKPLFPVIWHDLWKHTVQQPKCKLRL